jgi:hypothetical protein
VLAGAVILAIAVGARESRACTPERVCIWGPGIVPSAGITLRAPTDCAVREAGFLELPRVVASESLARWEQDPGYWTLADCFDLTVQGLAGGTRSTGDDLERLARNHAARADGGSLTVKRLDLATGQAVRADYSVSGSAFILPVGGYCIDHWLSADGAPVLLAYCSIGESFHTYEADPPWLAPTLASLQRG